MSSSIKSLIQNLEKLPLITFKGAAYRMHNPVWAWSPLSMQGASKTGGRFNPKGCSALYLGLSIMGCTAEVSSGTTNAILSPMTLCSYQIDIGGIIDLRPNYSALFDAPWRAMLLQGATPPGWELFKAISTHPQINGILAPSYAMRTESNLILYRIPNGTVTLHDPEERLKAVYGDQLNMT